MTTHLEGMQKYYLSRALNDVAEEWQRAKDKHGEMTMDGDMSGDPVRNDLLRLAALMEEVGEVAQLFTYDKERSTLRKELIQVANVALTWAAYLDTEREQNNV